MGLSHIKVSSCYSLLAQDHSVFPAVGIRASLPLSSSPLGPPVVFFYHFSDS